MTKGLIGRLLAASALALAGQGVAQATVYTVSYAGTASFTPHTGGSVAYTDTLSGWFETNDAVTGPFTAADILGLSFDFNRHTTYSTFSAAPITYDAPVSLSLSDLSGFSFTGAADGLSFSTGTMYDMVMHVSSGAGYVSSPAQPYTVGVVRAVAGSVPEPASWAMMVGGFGLVGFAMRRRARVIATA